MGPTPKAPAPKGRRRGGEGKEKAGEGRTPEKLCTRKIP